MARSPCTADFPLVFKVVTFISSITSLRPDIPALLDGENLEAVFWLVGKPAAGFALHSCRVGADATVDY